MKRYILFGGERCYAAGGWNDFLDMGDDADALKIYADSITVRLARDTGQIEWWHIFDTEAGAIVAESERGPQG